MAIEFIKKPFKDEENLSCLESYVKEWFIKTFKELTPPQKYSFKLISNGYNVVITAPTGSGKTIAGFLSILSELFKMGKEGKLKDSVYCIYVSPLKALDKHGFKEIKIRELETGYGWAKTSIKEKIVQAIINSYKEFGFEPEIWPLMAGSAPFCMFNREPLNLPFISGGLGHGGRAHAPNEYLVIQEGKNVKGLATLEKSYVSMLYNFSKIL